MRPGRLLAALLALLLGGAGPALAAGGESPQDVIYEATPPAPERQTPEEAHAKSQGCVSCHEGTDEKTMHRNPAVVLGCTDCHGGDATVMKPAGFDDPKAPAYFAAQERAHVLPR